MAIVAQVALGEVGEDKHEFPPMCFELVKPAFES